MKTILIMIIIGIILGLIGMIGLLVDKILEFMENEEA